MEELIRREVNLPPGSSGAFFIAARSQMQAHSAGKINKPHNAGTIRFINELELQKFALELHNLCGKERKRKPWDARIMGVYNLQVCVHANLCDDLNMLEF